MAFTGAATITQVTDRVVRITGVSLAKATAGVIGMFGDGGADIALPQAFAPKVHSFDGTGTLSLTPSDVVKCDVVPAQTSVGALPVFVTKAGATFASGTFRITITNPDAANATGNLEIWVQFQAR